MDFLKLNKILDAVCTDYDYGIVPDSVTVFARDSIAIVGKLELTLLEGIMVIIEISGEGSMVNGIGRKGGLGPKDHIVNQLLFE